MTNEQFEGLREWISQRIAIRSFADKHPADGSRMESLRRQLEEADDLARAILVDPEPFEETDLI